MGVTEFKLLSLVVVVVVEKWRNSISAVLKLYLYKTNSHSKQVQTQERAVTDFCSCRNTITTTKPTIVGKKRTRNKPELLGEMKEEKTRKLPPNAGQQFVLFCRRILLY